MEGASLLELLWLRYFKKLAEAEHLTHVAERLYISPPSLSATITKLEKELGVKLFNRSGRGIYLNNNGRIFLRYVNIALGALDDAVNEFSNISESPGYHLSIGVTSPVRYQRALFSFIKTYPEITLSQNAIDLPHFTGDELLKKYDFVFSASIDFNIEDCGSTVLYSDDVPMLAVYSSHPFSSLSEISLYKADKEVFIVTPQGSSARLYFDDLFNAAHMTPNIILECDYSMRRQMIIDKYGIGLSTLSTSLDDRSSEIKYIKISEPHYRRAHKITWHLKRDRSKAAELFYNFILAYYKDGVKGLSVNPQIPDLLTDSIPAEHGNK